jgi:hypothetical protein
MRPEAIGPTGGNRKRLRSAIFQEYDGHCFYCGKLLVWEQYWIGWQIDHAIPKSRGGSDGLENLRLSCPRCNEQKNTRTIDEYREYLREKSLKRLAQAMEICDSVPMNASAKERFAALGTTFVEEILQLQIVFYGETSKGDRSR